MPGNTHMIGGRWIEGDGAAFASSDPATSDVVWSGSEASAGQVDAAIAAAREAMDAWIDTPLEQRIARLEAFAATLERHKDHIAQAISLEVGKPMWESRGEVGVMIAKVPVSIRAYEERCRQVQVDAGGAAGVTRFNPHGVAAVLGPFNFPGHVPNGHIVPALLAGNTVVFKPSERTPLTAQRTVELWREAGLPPGVINLVQGGRDTAVAITKHAGIDAILFTGGTAAGLAIRKALADRPEVIVALEMGGNNPLVVWDAADLDAAAYLTVQSAYATAGQRCTCARRLIVQNSAAGEAFVQRLAAWIGRLRIGRFTESPEPFSGPVIDDAAAQRVLDAQSDWLSRGGRAIVESKQVGRRPAMIGPGLIDVTAVADRADSEVFGPLLQLIRVDDFDAAIREANDTSYGLVASLFSDRRDLYDTFRRRVRAGLINWNRQTTGASGQLPFGGVGRSGNHRPAGYYSVDYCAYPVASLEAERLEVAETLPPGITL